jgi:hypothetical protein
MEAQAWHAGEGREAGQHGCLYLAGVEWVLGSAAGKTAHGARVAILSGASKGGLDMAVFFSIAIPTLHPLFPILGTDRVGVQLKR